MGNAVKIGAGVARVGQACSHQPELEGLLVAANPPLRGRAALRLALGARLWGPEKYKLLEHRRRQAQIKARRLLAVAENAERALPDAEDGREVS